MSHPHLFPLSKTTPQNQTEGGWRIRATKSNFPALSGMSFYKLQLQIRGIREPHWHANADELGYCLNGSVLVSLFDSGNIKQTFLVETGEAFFIPSGALHTIENVSEGPSELILQFSHEEPEDFGLSAAFGMFSDAVLGNTWNQPASNFKSLPRPTTETFAAIRKQIPVIPKETRYSSPYRFRLQATPALIDNQGGHARLSRKSVWPILRAQALYSLELNGIGMREPHWHPETAELGYVHHGKGRMSILSPSGKVDTYQMNEGDIYFIPKAYPHHIENLSSSDTLNLLIFFDQPMPGDIGFTASVKSFSDETLAAALKGPVDLFKNLPTYYEDLFIVTKTTPST